jgi:D-alanyl-D-alanine carboxypeptidase
MAQTVLERCHSPGRFSLFIVLALAALTILIFGSKNAEARYAAMVIEPSSGKVVFSRNADTRKYPASLTKLMTLYMLFEAVDNGKLTLRSKIKASRRAARQPASRLGIRKGQGITVETAILALTIKSANDVATMVAEKIGGTESKFARMMTNKARYLGMMKTTFRNASGLPNSQQRSTARDMGRLAIALRRDFPHYYKYFSRKGFSWRGRYYHTHNNMLGNYKGADGMKTGYIKASGYNLVTSAKRNGKRLVGVVFGGRTAASRDRHMRKLLNLGFQRLQNGMMAGNAGDVWYTPMRTYATHWRFTNAPTPPMPPERFRRSARAGDWGIQVGAFARPSVAEQRISDLGRSVPGLLDGNFASIDKIVTDSGAVYRARIVGLSEREARDACRRLAQIRHVCIAVPPQQAALARDGNNG